MLRSHGWRPGECPMRQRDGEGHRRPQRSGDTAPANRGRGWRWRLLSSLRQWISPYRGPHSRTRRLRLSRRRSLAIITVWARAMDRLRRSKPHL